MSEAANIALNAIGMQDTHLLSTKSKDSLFNPSHKHNSDFRKYHRTHTVDNLQKNPWWPFGHTVKVDFNPKNMGDLLTNIWVKIALPEWSVSEASPLVLQNGALVYSDWAYGPYVGRRLIKNIRMRVDGVILQEIDTEMMVIFDNLYKNYDQKLALNAQFNLNRTDVLPPIVPGYGQTARIDDTRNIDPDAQTNIFIQIPFFFAQNYGGDAYYENKQNKPTFPLCSIYKQKIQFEIDFHKPSYFIYTNLTNNIILPSKMINNFQIVTEEVTLSKEERLYYKTKPIEITTEFIKKHSSRDINVHNDKTFSINLEPTIPVKMFHWFFRPKFFETEGNYDKLLVENRMFFKTAVPKEGPDPQPLDFINTLTVLDRAYFTLDGDRFPRATKMDVEYFKRIIPYTTKLSESGLSPTLQGYYALQNTSLTNSGGLQRTLIKDLKLNDIFSYNFAVYPKSTQPSGFLDFSQLNSDKTQLHIEIDQRTIQNRQRGHESMDDLTMYLYYTGYNVLRFEDGNVSFNG
jgi:hypothetical protein|tara:strand:- start:106 stop:1656 length:1551 start_codon:yes stop_codon:yes gene_type:complete